MDTLIERIQEMKKSTIKIEIENRIMEFESFQNKDSNSWFSELCFCILTANSSAESGIKAQKNITAEEFCNFTFEGLRERLKSIGYRFYNKRAEYIVKNQQYCDNIKDNLLSLEDNNKRREWLVSNVVGLGYKEASHFLRNVGYKDIAIIDRHILNILYENEYIKNKKINAKKYLEYENILKEIARKCELDLAKLDLYLWYIKTKKILK
ncbi:MAG: N-glycosylase/DNA lyase [Thermoplasmata archaeon]